MMIPRGPSAAGKAAVDAAEARMVRDMVLVIALERHGQRYVTAHARLRRDLATLAGHPDPEANDRQARQTPD